MIKHIFFDLDRTLWDFESNSHKTLLQLIKSFNLLEMGVDTPENFIKRYKEHNNHLWELYRKGLIEKDELRIKRFKLIMHDYGILDINLINKFAAEYIAKSPLNTQLFPFAIEVLEYLKKNYQLHILTNGFDSVQNIKLATSGIDRYFEQVITAEKAGFQKPDPNIFRYALRQVGSKPSECIMIGDDLLGDVIGAENVGIQGVYFNPNKIKHNEDVVHEISSLNELKTLL